MRDAEEHYSYGFWSNQIDLEYDRDNDNDKIEFHLYWCSLKSDEAHL